MAAGPNAKKQLLLVEDDPVMALAEKADLEQCGYAVRHVPDGKAAIELATAVDSRMELVLMDVELGKGMDGAEAARAILAQRTLPIIFLSAHCDPGMVARTEGIASYGYVVKSGGIVVLDAAIKMAFKLFESRQTELESAGELKAVEARKAEEALRESLELFSLFIRNSPIYTFIKEVSPSESRVLYASENYVDMIGVPGSLMRGKTMEELFPPEFAVKISADDWAVAAGGKVLKLDEDLAGRSYITVKYPIEQGSRKLLAGYTIDITERKVAEEEARRQVREKELILKEVQHRTKNNIAFIESLLQLQSSRLPDGEARDALMAAMARLETMLGIYEQLLLGTDYSSVSTRTYLEELARSIAAIFPDSERITLRTAVEDFTMPADRLRLVGSAVNELITNSLKYAYPGGTGGAIRLSLSREGEEAILSVEDDGQGLPEGFDPASSGGFGMMLVGFMAQQLKGSLTFGGGTGMRCSLRFSPGGQ